MSHCSTHIWVEKYDGTFVRVFKCDNCHYTKIVDKERKERRTYNDLNNLDGSYRISLREEL